MPHDRRVQGIKFGRKWSDYECADPYADSIDAVIELFGLDRAFADGDKSTKSVGWKHKAERVELFRNCFATAENLHRFMNGELDLDFYKDEISRINSVEHENQMALPL